MQIKQLKIRRFRGISELDWNISGAFICLIGSNDSTKSTILDAIEYALSPRWNITFTDTDFYNSQVDNPLEIYLTIGELPDELLSDGKFGLHLRGWHRENGLQDEPSENQKGSDDIQSVITICLRVDKSLEPTWMVITDREPEGVRISSSDREKLGMARLGSFVDRELSWSRGSSLSRFTGKTESISEIIADANRTAKNAIANATLNELQEAAQKAQMVAKDLGVKATNEFKPALDSGAASLSISGLSLHDGDIPVRLLGLGSRRLLTLALQKSITESGAILLIDEIEHGLEPHRLRQLIRSIQPPETPTENLIHAQTIFTTHSTIPIVECSANDLQVVRSKNGKTTIRQVSGNCSG